VLGVEQVAKPRIFRPTALRTFLTKICAEMNPEMSLSAKVIDYYSEVFNRFIFEKCVFDYWAIKRSKIDYVEWPENLKMDHFIECAWDLHKHDYELTFLYR